MKTNQCKSQTQHDNIQNKKNLALVGHHIGKDGFSPDDNKAKHNTNVKPSQIVCDLRSILKMIQFLGRYISHLPTTKKLVSTASMRVHFYVTKETTVSANTSSFGPSRYIYLTQAGKTKPVTQNCSGKMMHVVNAISRNPLPVFQKDRIAIFAEDAKAHIVMIELYAMDG